MIDYDKGFCLPIILIAFAVSDNSILESKRETLKAKLNKFSNKGL